MHEDRLTALDAGFLQAEDSDGHASLAVAALAIVAGPPPSFADVVAVVVNELHRWVVFATGEAPGEIEIQQYVLAAHVGKPERFSIGVEPHRTVELRQVAMEQGSGHRRLFFVRRCASLPVREKIAKHSQRPIGIVRLEL